MLKKQVVHKHSHKSAMVNRLDMKQTPYQAMLNGLKDVIRLNFDHLAYLLTSHDHDYDDVLSQLCIYACDLYEDICELRNSHRYSGEYRRGDSNVIELTNWLDACAGYRMYSYNFDWSDKRSKQPKSALAKMRLYKKAIRLYLLSQL